MLITGAGGVIVARELAFDFQTPMHGTQRQLRAGTQVQSLPQRRSINTQQPAVNVIDGCGDIGLAHADTRLERARPVVQLKLASQRGAQVRFAGIDLGQHGIDALGHHRRKPVEKSGRACRRPRQATLSQLQRAFLIWTECLPRRRFPAGEAATIEFPVPCQAFQPHDGQFPQCRSAGIALLGLNRAGKVVQGMAQPLKRLGAGQQLPGKLHLLLVFGGTGENFLHRDGGDAGGRSCGFR